MKEFNNKKMWESVIKHYREHNPVYTGCKDIFDEALEEQGFQFKGGEIIDPEAEPKWYIASEDYGSYDNSMLGKVPLFLRGERTTKEKVFKMCSDLMDYNITEEEFNKHFIPLLDL